MTGDESPLYFATERLIEMEGVYLAFPDFIPLYTIPSFLSFYVLTSLHKGTEMKVVIRVSMVL